MKEPKGQGIVPLLGVDLNTDESYIGERNAVFMRNLETKASNNSAAVTEQGGNELAFTPLLGNEEVPDLPLTYPSEEYFPNGTFQHRERNHGYVMLHHINGQHVLYRINGNNGSVQKVFEGIELNFQKDPRYFIHKVGRVVAFVFNRANPKTGLNEEITQLVFTDGYQDVFSLFVEDCIATNGFDAQLHPYFQGFDRNEYIRLGLPEPVGCISAVAIPRDTEDPAEAGKSNLINFRPWQWMIRFIDVWGRPSEYGYPSDQFILSAGSDCLASSTGLPRSVRLTLPAGNPTVDKIELLYRNSIGEDLSTGWLLYDTIEKYNNCEDKQWWERAIRSSLNYNADRNTIEYVFSGDREHEPVSQAAALRNQNYLPLSSSSVVTMNRRIALLNNKRGYEPMDCDQVKRLGLGIEPAPASVCGTAKAYKVEIYGLIWNYADYEPCPIKLKDGKPVFGLADCPGSAIQANNATMYGQTLPEQQEGIIGYLAGTQLHTISKQFAFDYTSKEEIFVGMQYKGENSFTQQAAQRKVFPVQKWEFNLPPGEYVFRIASHRSAPSDEYAKTSTTLGGYMPLTKDGIPNTFDIAQYESNEIVIKVTDSDIKLLDSVFVIWDVTNKGKNCSTNDRTSFVEGYVYEDEKNQRPIERARIDWDAGEGGLGVWPRYTDHNGHYFVFTLARRLRARIFGIKNSLANQLLVESDRTRNSEGGLYKFKKHYLYAGSVEYPESHRYTVKGKIVLCGNEQIGMPGVLLVMRNGQTAVTNNKGEFSLFAHFYGDTFNIRTEDLIISQRGGCPIIACGESCNYSFPHISSSSPVFSDANRIIDVGILSVQVKNVNIQGPQLGGRYGIGMVLQDWVGRKSFVEMDDSHYVDVPTIQQSGSFRYPKIRFNLQFVEFPSWARYVSFYATPNLNYDDFISWAVDRVQLVDNTGKVNNVAPTSIRLYYESLGEYNKQKNFSSNTRWQFISSEDNQPVLGDVVEFVCKGDGTLFPPGLTALVQYDKEGKYIQVDFNEQLREVGENTLIKIMRPSKKQEKQFYYSVCKQIKITNRKAEQLSGYVNIVDSYMQNRQIPVPIEVTKTEVDQDGNEIETKEFENQLRTYGFTFEHHSPSDLWGDHASNRGKVNVVNPYARTQFFRTEIAPSSSATSEGYFNFLHYFKDSDRVLMDEQEWGGITAGVTDVNTMLCICEHDNFVVGFDDNRVFVNENGQAVVRSAAAGIGRPDRKIGSNYGCQSWDINTIALDKGRVFFMDSAQRCLVLHNFNQAVPISENLISSWLRSSISDVQKSRQPSIRPKYFHSVIDPKRGTYLLTKSYLNSTRNEWVNQLPYPSISDPETVSVLLEGEQPIFRFVSFAPQMYLPLQGDFRDKQLFSLCAGELWYHYDLQPQSPKFNNFFGIECEPYVEVVFNAEPGESKLFLYTEVVCKEVLLYADRIETEAGQISRLMPKWFNRFERMWAAAFLCALNTDRDANISRETGANVLLDGEQLHGRWIKVRYTVKDRDRNKYFELVVLNGYYIM